MVRSSESYCWLYIYIYIYNITYIANYRKAVPCFGVIRFEYGKTMWLEIQALVKGKTRRSDDILMSLTLETYMMLIC